MLRLLPSALRRRIEAGRWRLFLLCAVLLGAGSGSLVNRLSFDAGVEELRSNASHRLDLYANGLEREVDKYAQYPFVAELDERVQRLFAAPDDADRVQLANNYLEHLNQRAGSLAIYVLTPQGKVLASSNWNRPDSFIGRDLSYRSYVHEAQTNKVARFYGIGTTNNEPGCYLAAASQREGRTVGIVVVKVSLERLEESWLTAESPAIVADENGVVVLASVPEWKYASLAPLSAQMLQHLDETQQYNRHSLPPLGLRVEQSLDDNARTVSLPRRQQAGKSVFATDGLFLAQSRLLPGATWRLTVFSDLRRARDLAHTRAALAALGMVAALLLGVMFFERRRNIRERLAAQTALQHAYADLEQTVAHRTQELQATNAQLAREVEERVLTEQTLRAAQEELIQAGKLAVIGQLSAGIAHELNQPLAALGALSSNAEQFLDLGDLATTRFNLQRIADLVARMGALTAQLRAFSRKSNGELGAVAVATAIDNAVSLLEQRLNHNSVAIVRHAPAHALYAHANAVRLEQVLVNLIRNAFDAVNGHAQPQVTLTWCLEDEQVRIDVADNGPGLSEQALAHLFEPFFTTKGSGGGLGLGLTISAGIMRSFGGTISAGNSALGGAVFTLKLTPAADPSHHE